MILAIDMGNSNIKIGIVGEIDYVMCLIFMTSRKRI